MASGPITSWQIDGETMEKWETLFPWAPESLQMMTAPWNKKMMLLGRKAMTSLDSILKSRDITLPTKVRLVKSMVFTVVRYGCELDHEGWMVKNGCFWTVVLEKILERVQGWIARRSNQSILQEINPEYSLEGLMLKLKLQYFGHLMQRANSLEKTLMLGKIEAEGEGDDRGWDGWMASLTLWIWVWASSRRWWRTGKPGILQSMGSQRVRHDWATEQQPVFTWNFDTAKNVSSSSINGREN